LVKHEDPPKVGGRQEKIKLVAWGNDDRDHGTEKTDGKQCQQHATILK